MLFNKAIFQYTTYIDASLATRGSLVVHPTATVSNCKAGTILRENGKKLNGLTHPDLKDPASGLTYTHLVGVYDIISGINGFINPDAPFFAVLNTDKTYQDDTRVEQVDASVITSSSNWNYSNTAMQILGPPIMTAGDIYTSGSIDTYQLRADDLIYTPSNIISGPPELYLNFAGAGRTPEDYRTATKISYGAGTMLAKSNITSLANIYASNGVVHGSNVVAQSNMTVNTGNLTITAGRLILNANNSGVANMGPPPAVVDGNFKKLTVTSTACRTTSQVFLTYAGMSGGIGFLSSEEIANGSFRIVSSSNTDTGSVRWMVIN
jgi:hypothetical protein